MLLSLSLISATADPERWSRLARVTFQTSTLIYSSLWIAIRYVSGVHRFSDFIDRLLARPELLSHLQPKEPLFWVLSDKFRAMDDSALTDGKPIQDPAQFTLVRGAVLYALDELDAAHRIFQEDHSDLGSYWHGMMHRREGDFENARYWFWRAGRLPAFQEMHEASRSVSPTMARQEGWDPYLLTGQCEQVRFGAHELTQECQRLLRVEFDALLEHSWKKALGE